MCFVLQADLAFREGSGYFFVNASVGGIAEVVVQEGKGTAEVRRSLLYGLYFVTLLWTKIHNASYTYSLFMPCFLGKETSHFHGLNNGLMYTCVEIRQQ